MLPFLKAGYQKFKQALLKTRSTLGSKLKNLFKDPLDEATFDQLEQILFEADLGSATATELVEEVRSLLRKAPQTPFPQILQAMKEKALAILSAPPPASAPNSTAHPHVILIVGVNGSGKTTTIAKLASLYKNSGKKVLLAAGDTFRAAAVEQLEIWAERLSIPIVKGQTGSDPSAIAFDALSAAKARECDLVLIDTAGRLQNKTELMRELEKIKRTCAKVIPQAPHETLLVLDATTGQNGIDQAEIFHQFTPLTGVVLTKLDGSAKGGVALGLYKKTKIPILWVGLGEGEEDLAPFEAEKYVNALFDIES